MDKFEVGMLVRSKAGHDHGKVYLIQSVEEGYVFLVDGKIRTLDHPKRKKRKHLQWIQKQYDLTGLDDVAIKCILKTYNREEA